MAYQPKSYRKFVAGTVTAAVVASAVAPVASAATPTFSDVPANHQFAEAINALAADGTFIGQGGKFDMYGEVTRRQAAVVFSRLIEGEGKMEQVFSDVPTTDGELTKAAYEVNEAKVMTGANGKLMPYSKLTRQQMAKIIVEYFDFKPVEGSTVEIKDLDKADASLRDYIQILAENGITQVADGNFRPTDNVSRGQFAAFIYRAQQAVAGPLAIESVTALDDTNKYLQITFNKAVSELDPSDISIKDAKSGDKFGVQEVKLSANGKSAQLTLFENTENDFVLKENTEYTVTVNVNGQVLTSTFYDAAFIESRVVDINVADREFTAVDDKTGVPVKIEVPTDVTFDFEQAMGELVRVWYNDDKELLKSEIVKPSAKYDGIEITDTDEIKLLSEDKKYDVSDEKFTKNTDKNKLAFYVDGKEVDLVDGELPASYKDKKYNFAKVGFNKSGDVEYISVYNLKNFLVVDSVDGDEVVGVEGESGGSFNAEDATIIKDGKVIALSDLKKGDVLYFSTTADDEDGFAVVYNKTVTGEIETVYNDAIRVGGKTYNFIYDGSKTDAFNVDYAQAVYVKDGELEKLDADAAEDLQAGGDVTLYLDPAGNLVYVSGETADVDSNTLSAILTDKVSYDEVYKKDKIQVEALLENNQEVLKEFAVEDLDTITVNGTSYDIDNDDEDVNDKDYVVDVDSGGVLHIYKNVDAKGAFANEVDYGTDIDLDAVEGALVKLHLDDDKNIEEVELFSDNAGEEGVISLGETLEAGDTYFKGNGDSKKLKSNTVVYDATDGFDADDISITTWGEYKGSDISEARAIYNDDNEVVALAITKTTTSDKVYEEAVITDVLRNKDEEIVEVSAYVNGQEKTFQVDEVKETLGKGDVAVLAFDDNDTDLVKDVVTVSELNAATPTDEVKEEFGTGYVVENLVVDRNADSNGFTDGVDVGNKKVKFANGDTYTLVSGGAVIDRTDRNDISVESLTDLRDENIKVTVILDAKGGTFAKYFVFEEIGATEYSNLKGSQEALNTATTKVEAAEAKSATAVTTTTKTNIDAAQTALEDAQTAVNALSNSAEKTALQNRINTAKADVADEADFTFTATKGTDASHIKLTFAGTDVTDFSTGYTVTKAGEANGDTITITNTTGAVAGAYDDSASTKATPADETSTVTVTVKNNFWNVSDTVTVTVVDGNSTATPATPDSTTVNAD